MIISSEAISGYEQRYRTNLINSITGFKSVALVGSISKTGATNLAIFSQIIHVGANPPLIGMLFRPHTVVRHTLENILATRFFTINHIPASHVQQAHHTSARWDISEFDACGFTPEYSKTISAPYVKESPLQIGCQLAEKQEITVNQTIFVVGEIKEIRLSETAVGEDGFVDLEQIGTVSCSGLDSYHLTQKIGRYAYAKPDRQPEKL